MEWYTFAYDINDTTIYLVENDMFVFRKAAAPGFNVITSSAKYLTNGRLLSRPLTICNIRGFKRRKVNPSENAKIVGGATNVLHRFSVK
ncbi:MAG: hypothetical protein JKY88_16410 [Pseudomonadales bacterium]|nr:hypothetical protein [Pseudomonadales bacterium]